MKYLIFLLLAAPLELFSQENCAMAPVEKHVVLANKGERAVKKTKKSITIKLVGDFDDTCKLYANDSLLLSKYVATDPLLGESRFSVSLNKKDYDDSVLLKMLMPGKNACFTETLSFKYPVLEIRYYNNKWILTYTNRVAQLE